MIRNILLTASTIFTLSSCSTYYYSVLESPNLDTECVENGDFLFENDSLWVAYNFEGYNTPVKITVYNKLNVPLQVDWEKSALIINSEAIPYASSDKPFHGGSISETVQTHYDRSVTFKEFGGVIEASKHKSYIFPHAMQQNKFMNIYFDYKNLNKSDYQQIDLVNKSNRKVKAQKMNFSPHNSPLQFQSYLTLYYDEAKPITVKTDFYIAGVIKTSAMSPNNMPHNMADKGNISFYEHSDDTWQYVLGGAAVAGVLIWGIVEYSSM